MKIPNADAAFVAEKKIRDYLLNAAHPDNSGKAAFFMALGFGVEDWPALAGSLREIARNTEVAETFESIHGRKYTQSVASSRPAAGCLSCKRYGLSTAEKRSRDW